MAKLIGSHAVAQLIDDLPICLPTFDLHGPIEVDGAGVPQIADGQSMYVKCLTLKPNADGEWGWR